MAAQAQIEGRFLGGRPPYGYKKKKVIAWAKPLDSMYVRTCPRGLEPLANVLGSADER
jgi:hypothetical protein